MLKCHAQILGMNNYLEHFVYVQVLFLMVSRLFSLINLTKSQFLFNVQSAVVVAKATTHKTGIILLAIVK